MAYEVPPEGESADWRIKEATRKLVENTRTVYKVVAVVGVVTMILWLRRR